MSRDITLAWLRLSTFRGLQNLPLFVAMRQGYFGARGLAVDILYTSGSAAQIAGLTRGEYELIQTAPDNVISVGSAPSSSDRSDDTPIVMLLGGSVGPLSVYAQPRLSSLADLRGTILGVDNPGSGFALMLRDILARDSLILDHDYTFTVSGGTSVRLDALKDGSASATLLYAPYDALAESAGLQRLATSTAYYASYSSLATAGLRGWVDLHAREVTDYISAILQSLHWIYDAANVDEVRALLQEETTLGLDAATAARAYAAFIAPRIGFGEDARLDEAGLAQVIALRSAYGTPAQKLGSPVDYCDLRWYDRAREAEA
jgi:ABC-type nitrate/sulfonate/bicarbonate transport system substrate-binding protein